MQNRIWTNSLRSIRKAFPRFLSLLVMSALGVFVFAGLTASAPDMRASLDDYLDTYESYDLRIVSDMGLTAEDVRALQSVDGIREAEASSSQDVIVKFAEDELVVRVMSVPERINTLELVSGRLPETAGEIVCEEALLSGNGLSIGDTICLEDDTFREQTVTIVGTVKSVLYYSSTKTAQNRGNTNIGSGKISYYAYVQIENFDRTYDSDIYVTLDGAKELMTGSAAYEALSEAGKGAVEAISGAREQARYDGLYQDAADEIEEARREADQELSDAWGELSDAQAKLSDAETELSDARAELDDAAQELADAKTQLSDAETEIADKEQELSDAKQTLAEAKEELDQGNHRLSDAKTQLDDAEAEIADKEQELSDAEAALNTAKQQIEAGEQTLSDARTQLDEKQQALTEQETQLEGLKQLIDAGMGDPETLAGYQQTYDNGMAALTPLKDELAARETDYQTNAANLAAAKTEYETNKVAYDAGMQALSQAKTDLENGRETYRTQSEALLQAQAAYDSGKADYDHGVRLLADAKADLADGQNTYEENLKKYEDGEADYEEGLASYEEGLAEYEDGLADYEAAKEEADQEIADAWEELSKLAHPTWYVYERTDGATYGDYMDDSGTIENLALIFPVVFFLVAVLVSLISMNRMVEDDRLEIGTLKSMGFSNGRIMSKYALFSLLATVIGGIIGAVLGLRIIPGLIIGIYKILFDLPKTVYLIHPMTTILGFLITVICVCGTSILTAYQVLREKPSELMRPKAPKKGKRVFLERIGPVWSRISFSNKVTIRNLFRYRKRVMVTVGGIAGCTALLLCGFGIKDAIVDLPNYQYGEIFCFDGMSFINKDGIEKTEEMYSAGAVSGYQAVDRRNVTIEGLNGYVFAAKDADALGEIIHLKDVESGETVELKPGCVVITEKMADVLDISIGDTLTFRDLDQNTYSYPVCGLARNYFEHYIFMDRETLEASMEWSPNLVYFQMSEMTQEAKDETAESLLSNDEVLAVTYRDDFVNGVDNMLKSLDNVVWILLVLSALLAFVVLYNLSNININERKREIATLKVLGFYDKEVDSYITKETIFLTLFGIGLGLLLGIILSKLVVGTIEIELARFINKLKPMSFVYSALLASAFTWIVNRITHFTLKRIEMIDSLKSVE